MPKPIIRITGLPIPPTINSSYVSAPNGRRFPSRELKAFKKAAEAALFIPNLNTSVGKLTARNGCRLSLRLTFFFPHASLICKDGSTKRLDVSNRIKLMEDAVAKALGIDDKHFWHVEAAKVVTVEDPQCMAEVFIIDELI